MTDEHHDARQQAEELQMHACLTELGGVGPERPSAWRFARTRRTSRNVSIPARRP